MAAVAAGSGTNQTLRALYYGLVVRDEEDEIKVYIPRDQKLFSEQIESLLFVGLPKGSFHIGKKASFGRFRIEEDYPIDQVRKFEPIAKIRCDVWPFPNEQLHMFEDLTTEERRTEVVDLVNSFWQGYVDAVRRARSEAGSQGHLIKSSIR